jgi:hypothetical protein
MLPRLGRTILFKEFLEGIQRKKRKEGREGERERGRKEEEKNYMRI